VAITSQMLGKLRAPLFRAIVEHLEAPGREVFLQSTFALEHAVMSTLTFDVPNVGQVFLLGDAAVSLPFFRGMSCLARCAHSLARVHCDLAAGDRGAVARYDREADEIKRSEIAVVRSRAQLVRILRELVRVSALLPFPIQSWWLSAEDHDHRPAGLSLGWFGNFVLAIAALGAVALGRFWSVAVPLEIAGGVAYHASLAFERGSQRLLRRLWQLQVACVAAIGLLVAYRERHMMPAAWWLILGGAFVIGLYAYERLLENRFQRAELR
jgi:hypothetical protein